MRKFIVVCVIISACFWAVDSSAQSRKRETKNKFTPYGFFRTAAIFDTRDSKAGSEDMFYFRPVDYKYNFQGQDIYENFSLKSYALAHLRTGELRVSRNVLDDL